MKRISIFFQGTVTVGAVTYVTKFLENYKILIPDFVSISKLYTVLLLHCSKLVCTKLWILSLYLVVTVFLR